MKVEKTVAIVGSIVTAVALVAIIAAFHFSEIPSGFFRVGFRTFQPEYILISDARVSESLGALEEDLPFEAFLYQTDLPEVIPAGTSYYSVEGLDKAHYLALPYGGFYFLYSTYSDKRIALKPLANDDALQNLRDEYAGTQAQACYEVFTQVEGYEMSYCVLWIYYHKIDDPAALLKMIIAYCDNRGITIVADLDYNMLKERGYWQDDLNGGFGGYDDGLQVSLGHYEIGTAERSESGNIPPVDETSPPAVFEGEVSVVMDANPGGAFHSSDRLYILELIDGAWAVRDSWRDPLVVG